ncbi:MAG: peptidylprolyl isomerase [archaeon]
MVKKHRNDKSRKDEKDETFHGLKVYKANGNGRKEVRARRFKIMQMVLLVLIVIGGVAAIFSLIKIYSPSWFGRSSLYGELAAKVNSRPITMAELDKQYERLPLQYKYYITKEQLLDKIIDEMLLSDEAMKQGVSASDDDVTASLNDFTQQNNLTNEQFEELLKNKSMTLSEIKGLVKSQLLLDRFINQSVKAKINLSTEIVLQYYNEHPELFKVPELVTAKHILFMSDNASDKEAAANATRVLSMVKNDKSNFCDLVKQYSSDPGSLDTCGQYIFPKGQMDADFERRAFDQKIGEMSIVKTVFGYHIIWTTNKTPEQLVRFGDVQDQIVQVLAKQQENAIYAQLIADLRAKAKIVNYLAAKNESGIVLEDEEVAEGSAEASQEGDIKVTISQPSDGADKVAEGDEAASEQEEIAKAVEETPAIEEAAVEEVKSSSTQASVNVVPDKLSCFVSNEAVLYGAYWDSSTKKQKEAFGSDASKLRYVECGVQGDYKAQSAECAKQGIQAYPTWIIDGKKHMGVYPIDELAVLAGC